MRLFLLSINEVYKLIEADFEYVCTTAHAFLRIENAETLLEKFKDFMQINMQLINFVKSFKELFNVI